jgi:hypothetical protein
MNLNINRNDVARGLRLMSEFQEVNAQFERERNASVVHKPLELSKSAAGSFLGGILALSGASTALSMQHPPAAGPNPGMMNASSISGESRPVLQEEMAHRFIREPEEKHTGIAKRSTSHQYSHAWCSKFSSTNPGPYKTREEVYTRLHHLKQCRDAAIRRTKFHPG